MERDALKQMVLAAEEQLLQVELAIAEVKSDDERENLISVKSDIQQLIELTRENQCLVLEGHPKSDPFADEYASFMSEMKKEGVVISEPPEDGENRRLDDEDLKSLEGTKCRAPYKHNWGDVVYHNAMICSITNKNYADSEVKVMFTNPTHQDMLPCPFYLETGCKFSEELCRYSHGEVVSFSALQKYVEPNFASVSVGSKVLAKKEDGLWYRASVKRILDGKCVVKFDCYGKDAELDLHDLFPLESVGGEEIDGSGDEEEETECNIDDVINMSLMIAPSDQSLGNWEKHTKGIGSKLMEKMGYVIGTGLGKNCDGRVEPVTAVILPTGKSLDHCMKLRENAGGDENLFDAERKLKKMQRRLEIRNERAYERERRKVDVFDFLNGTLSSSRGADEEEQISRFRHDHRREIKKETSRELNVAGLKVEEDIRHLQQDLGKIRESLARHADKNSQVHRNLKQKLTEKECELQALRTKAVNIQNEQSIRKDKRKLTVF